MKKTLILLAVTCMGLHGTNLYASSLQGEIDAVAAKGGGRVSVPHGEHFSDGPIRLRSNVELHLEEGAKIVFSDDPQKYLPAVPTSWEGVECLNYSPLVYAYGCTNVAITGKGTFAPKMKFWRKWFARDKGHRDATRKLYDWCSFNAPLAARDVTKLPGSNVRPHLIQFNRCKDVRLEGFKIRESPFWTVHLYLCDGVVVRGLDVYAHGHNNDGIDIDMTRNVLVEDCRFDQGDDAIVIKSGRNQDAWRLATPSENIEVRNCTVVNGHVLLGIGSEMSGGVRNVWMHDCRLEGEAMRLFYVKTNERRGGFVENIRMERVKAKKVRFGVIAAETDVLYQWRDFPTHEVRVTPIRNLSMKDVEVEEAERLVDVRGDKRMPVEGVTLENVRVGLLRKPDRIENAANVKILPPDAEAESSPRKVLDFNSGWEWRRGGEKAWRAVDLPHDFMFESPWDEKAVHSQRVFKPFGEAFYRKTFAYDPAWEGRRVILDFGGIMFFGDVRLNGKKVAETEYGYLGFETDVTDRLKKDGPNVVEVWAKVEGGSNGSRWYTGGGLYRGVKMKLVGAKRIARHGVYVKTKGETVFVEVELDGFRGERGDYEIVAESEGVRTSAPVTKGDNRRRFAVALPPFEMKGAARWSPEAPNLHALVVTVSEKGGAVVDRVKTRFGLRDIAFSKERGFELDGRHIFLKGQSNHHDLGALGTAAYPDAIRRSLRTIKKFGFNSVRCSHNPYSVEFYDIADEEGIVVVDEICDKWVRNWAGRKPYLEMWPQLVTEWVKRDRNHPSVVMWSLGNELQMNESYHDATFEDWGVTTYRMMDLVVKRWDATRPTTVAMFPTRANGIGKNDKRFNDKAYWIAPELAQASEVASFNYQWRAYGEYLKNSPEMILYQSEATTSEWLDPYFGMDRAKMVGCSYWGATEYWGESNGYPKKGWNWSFFSHTMKPYPQAWLMKSGFDRAMPVTHIGVVEKSESQEWNEVKSGQQVLRENWNRKAGEKARVWVFSNAAEVELFLNGRTLGKKEVVRPPEGDGAWRRGNLGTTHAVQFEVAWEPGALRAVGSNGSEHMIRTTGPAVGLKFEVERYPELSFVWIKAVDKAGLEVPDAQTEVSVSVEGAGRLLALDDGDHCTDQLFNVERKSMKEGALLAIVRRTGAGRIRLVANGMKQEL